MSALDPYACDKCGYETTIVKVMTAYQTTGSDGGSPIEEGRQARSLSIQLQLQPSLELFLRKDKRGAAPQMFPFAWQARRYSLGKL